MSTISQKLTQLLNAKVDIASAIESKGVSVPSDAPFSTYARLIDNIDTEVQSDWNQNNSNASDYIKNRPFYSDGTTETKEYFPSFMIGEMDESAELGGLTIDLPVSSLLETGQTYTLTVGDNSIDFVAKSESYDSLVITYIGDSYMHSMTDPNYIPEYGFTIASAIVDSMIGLIFINNAEKFITLYNIGSVDELLISNISMHYIKENVVKIPLKYIPLSVSYVQDTSNITSIDFSKYKPGEIVLLVTGIDAVLPTASKE